MRFFLNAIKGVPRPEERPAGTRLEGRTTPLQRTFPTSRELRKVPLSRGCIAGIAVFPAISGDLSAFLGHHLLYGGARQRAAAVLDDARQLRGVDPVAFQPTGNREQVRVADRILLT